MSSALNELSPAAIQSNVQSALQRIAVLATGSFAGSGFMIVPRDGIKFEPSSNGLWVDAWRGGRLIKRRAIIVIAPALTIISRICLAFENVSPKS